MGGTREEPEAGGTDEAGSSSVPAINRLRWRARRGTRELDALFGGWIDECFGSADEATRKAFDELLDVQDPDLWDWVMGYGRATRADWQAIIDDIRSRHRL
jgi:antitoxin CptB